jgi:hypothetical protein
MTIRIRLTHHEMDGEGQSTGTLAAEIALMATAHKFLWKIETVDNGRSA